MMSFQENHFHKELIDKKNTSAFRIQCSWRAYKIRQIIRDENERIRNGIRVFVTSLTYNPKWTTDTERTKYLFRAHHTPFTVIDVVESKTEWKKLNLGDVPFPAIFIFGNYIGTFEDLQDLVDNELFTMIINQDYERKCLICYMPRRSLEKETCSSCWKKYLFFVKSTD